MNYKVEVSDEIRILETWIFCDYDRALYLADRRRKQGYTVTVKVIIIK